MGDEIPKNAILCRISIIFDCDSLAALNANRLASNSMTDCADTMLTQIVLCRPMVIIILRIYYCCVLPGNRSFRLDSSSYLHICMFRNMAFFRVSLLSVLSSQLFYNHNSYNNLYIEGNVNSCCEYERFSIDCCESDASNRRHDCCHIFYCLVLKELLQCSD